jgi:hypothetical protein
MSFRLIVRLSGDRGTPGYGDCALASDALALCRRLSRTRVRVEEIIDLRWGGETRISVPELEAIALGERRDRHAAALAAATGVPEGLGAS